MPLDPQGLPEIAPENAATPNSLASAGLTGGEAVYRAAFSQATVGMATTDLAGKVLWINEAFARMVGRPPEELIGRDSRHYSHPEDIERNADIIRRIQEEGLSNASYEKRYLRPDGGIVLAHVNLAPVRENGRLVSMVAVIEEVTERRRAEQELADAQRRLNASLAAAEIGTWVFEVQENRVFADKNLARLFFVPAEDAINGAPLELFTKCIHPEDQSRVAADIAAAVARGGAYETDYRVVNPNTGAIRWLIARGMVELDEAGRAEHFTGVVQDVTTRKEAQRALAAKAQELAQQTRVFDTMLSATDDFTYLFDRQGRFLYANRPLLELYGLPFEKVVGKSFDELNYPDWLVNQHMSEIRTVIATRRPIKGSVPFTGANGRAAFFDYTFSPVFGENGEVETIAGTTHDVTAQRQAQEAIREGKERLDLAVEAAQLGTFDWALPEGSGPIEWNPRLRSFYWLNPDEPINRRILDRRVHPADLPVVQRALDRAIYEGDRYDVEYRIIGPEGQVRWVRGIGKSFRDETGVPVRFGGIAMDVTLQKQVEEEREGLLAAERTARASAERASQMKDEFLATLSHELRTPLNAILGWAQVLRSSSGDDSSAGADNAEAAAELEQGLATIERNARAQAQIIDDLLDMSRIISGKVRLDVQKVEILPVIQAAIDSMLPTIQAKGIRLQTILDPLAKPVGGDPNRLQQVFWNLLSNAIKFTPRGGRIQVTLARVNSHLEIIFGDSGEGIAAEFLPHVFDRFRQADATATRRHGGLGLGLAIVKQLVELHGGSVRAASDGPGRGSCFTVSLPVLAALQMGAGAPEPGPEEAERRHPQAEFAARVSPPPRENNASPGTAANRVNLQGLKILVVDDEADARGLLKRLLEDRGAEVVLADSAQAAYELAVGQTDASSRPDILVSDIGMPGEDGYSLIQRIRAHEGQESSPRKLPAVALTAYARTEDRMKAVLAGFQMHTTKPVEAAELIAIVASLAGRI